MADNKVFVICSEYDYDLTQMHGFVFSEDEAEKLCEKWNRDQDKRRAAWSEWYEKNPQPSSYHDPEGFSVWQEKRGAFSKEVEPLGYDSDYYYEEISEIK